ncbi:10255_t:CDS:2 [Paraglomus brasilianum]|uniref:10255_t:CDS:1 n=1 Tax=Paraglomus brasilianum TaxID=144538 RepID=A0A9N8WG59_9GLOM|nr:10255_t:CDS:2 [Paraglomus brasilianum]
MSDLISLPDGQEFLLYRCGRQPVCIKKLSWEYLVQSKTYEGKPGDAKKILTETVRLGLQHEGLEEEAVTRLVNCLWKKKAIQKKFKEIASDVKTSIKRNKGASIILDSRVSASSSEAVDYNQLVDYNQPLPPPLSYGYPPTIGPNFDLRVLVLVLLIILCQNGVVIPEVYVDINQQVDNDAPLPSEQDDVNMVDDESRDGQS